MIKTVLEYNRTFPDIKIKCDIKNRQSLTPLTLAAYLGKIEVNILEFLFNMIKNVLFLRGPETFSIFKRFISVSL